MIELHLYGDLRRHAPDSRPTADSVIHLPADGIRTLGEALRQAGIHPAEVQQVFLNGALLRSSSRMAPWLGYVSAEDRVPARGSFLEAEVRPGDRLGLFPARMAMLVV